MAVWVVKFPREGYNRIKKSMTKTRTTRIALDSVLRGKITIMLKIKKFSKPFQ